LLGQFRELFGNNLFNKLLNYRPVTIDQIVLRELLGTDSENSEELSDQSRG
jgi:hypothetical protein